MWIVYVDEFRGYKYDTLEEAQRMAELLYFTKGIVATIAHV